MKLSQVKISKSGSTLPWEFRVIPWGNRFAVEEMTPWVRTWTFVTSWESEEQAKKAADFYKRTLS